MLRLVPFNDAWINHVKLDLHAIYLRPRFIEDEFGEMQREVDAQGLPTWDLTGPLQIKQHNHWRAKGFEYVTLADRQSLLMAVGQNALLTEGEEGGLVLTADWRQYDQHQTGGPWNYKKYRAGQVASTSKEADLLRADVETYGSAVVEAIRKRHEPDFKLPPTLRNIPAGGTVPVAVAVAAAPVVVEAAATRTTDGKFKKAEVPA